MTNLNKVQGVRTANSPGNPSQNNEGLLVHRVPPRANVETPLSLTNLRLWQFPKPCSEHRGSACSEQRPPRDSYQVETPLSLFK